MSSLISSVPNNHDALVCSIILSIIKLLLNNSVRCICSSAGHGRKTGTNLHAALHRVSEVINFFKQNSAKNNFDETQNIIIIETDGSDTGNVSNRKLKKPFKLFFKIWIYHVFLPAGYSNTGNKPQIALARIRGLLGYHNKSQDHTDETMLGIVKKKVQLQTPKLHAIINLACKATCFMCFLLTWLPMHVNIISKFKCIFFRCLCIWYWGPSE